jgi:TolB-like protein/Tfp pilus assembly protein PilF
MKTTRDTIVQPGVEESLSKVIRPVSSEPVISVLQFSNLTGETNYDLFCEGLSYDLVLELSRFRQFHIYTSQAEDNRSYHADYIVRGSFRYKDGSIRIDAQLINNHNGKLVWAGRFDGKHDALLSIEEELMQQLVSSLQQQLDTDLLANISKRPTHSIKAYEYWLKGLQELKKGTAESDITARGYFEEAIKSDPSYSLAYSGISLSYFNEWSCQLWNRWDINQRGAKEWAEKALALDDMNYIACMVLGKVYLYECKYEQAEHYLDRAITLNPNDPFNLAQVALSYSYAGRLNDAEQLYRKAVTIDPLNADQYHVVGSVILFEQGRYKECLELGEQYIHAPYVDYPAFIAAAHYYTGNTERAVYYWEMFLDNFRTKILANKSAGNIGAEAIAWMAAINPYRHGSRIDSFGEYITGGQAPVRMPGMDDTHSYLFQQNGKLRVISYMGVTAQLPDSKGCADIAALLAEPGKHFHSSDFTGMVAEHGQEVIDAKAKKEYAEKIRSLQEDISHADRNNDIGRLQKLEEEYDALLQHLGAAIGADGKSRKFQRSTDKARSAVTQRIKSAIKKIAEVHPVLGNHLERTIKTGVYCAYLPEQETDWRV